MQKGSKKKGDSLYFFVLKLLYVVAGITLIRIIAHFLFKLEYKPFLTSMVTFLIVTSLIFCLKYLKKNNKI